MESTSKLQKLAIWMREKAAGAENAGRPMQARRCLLQELQASILKIHSRMRLNLILLVSNSKLPNP